MKQALKLFSGLIFAGVFMSAPVYASNHLTFVSVDPNNGVCQFRIETHEGAVLATALSNQTNILEINGVYRCIGRFTFTVNPAVNLVQPKRAHNQSNLRCNIGATGGQWQTGGNVTISPAGRGVILCDTN